MSLVLETWGMVKYGTSPGAGNVVVTVEFSLKESRVIISKVLLQYCLGNERKKIQIIRTKINKFANVNYQKQVIP